MSQDIPACPHCAGYGVLVADRSTCPTCHGIGLTSEDCRLDALAAALSHHLGPFPQQQQQPTASPAPQ